MGKYVCSYSVFGTSYWGVFPLLLRAHFAVFPASKWQMHIYHDNSLDTNPYKDVILRLNREGLISSTFVPEKVLKCRAMLWRLMPVWSDDVDFVFCKDADSIPTIRERKIMEDFVGSGFAVMGINDNPAHSIPLMGGMMGFNNKRFISVSGIRSFRDFMSLGYYAESEWNRHGSDQSYIESFLFNKVAHATILYRVFGGSGSLGRCCNVLQVPDIKITDINPEVVELGDFWTNYIGACGVTGPNDPVKFAVMQKYGCRHVLDFYDKFGNADVNKILREEEKRLFDLHGIRFD